MVLSAEQVESLIRGGLPMADDVDFRVERIDERGAVVRIPYSDKLVRPGGTLAGPIIMTAADAAMYAAILGRLGRAEMAVTSNLNINFLTRPAPRDLIAEATLLKLGKRLAFCEVNLFSAGEEEPVAHVTGSYSLPPS